LDISIQADDSGLFCLNSYSLTCKAIEPAAQKVAAESKTALGKAPVLPLEEHL